MEKSFTTESKLSYTDKVAEKIIEALENGTAPWIKPWKGSDLMDIVPVNPITKNRYKGINFINLSIEQMNNGYDDSRWLTYKQAESIGAQVRKGEKGVSIQYWKFKEDVELLDEKGKPVLDEQGKPKKETIDLENPKVFYSTVFNAAQMDNMPKIEKIETPKREFEAIEAAERIISNSGANVTHKAGNRAFYSPSNDSITLPLKDQFRSEMEYYGTALHELGHWTGHTSRLNRQFGSTFGSQAYAREELRAEIASYMICSELGVDFDPGNHHAYINSWVQSLKDTPSEIFKAAADAGKIENYLQGLNNMNIQEHTVNEEQENSQIFNVADFKERVENKPRFSSMRIPYECVDDAINRFGTLRVDDKEINSVHAEIEIENKKYHLSAYANKMAVISPYSEISKWKETAINNPSPTKVLTILKIDTPQLNKDTFQEKTFLSVPFKEKDIAKAAGAKWDNDSKLWYAPAGVEIEKLSAYLPDKVQEKAQIEAITQNQNISKDDAITQFRKALEAHGLIIDGDPIMDSGKMIRVQVEGDKHGEKSGAYIGYTDGRPAGVIQNFKTGAKDKWIAQGEDWKSFNSADLEAQRAKMEQNKMLRDKERAEEWETVSQKVSSEFNGAKVATNAHPYLVEKNISSYGLKLDERGNLLMPLSDINGKTWTAQHIGMKGFKGFEPGGKKEGNFFIIGADSIKDIETPILCEGYATGASIHEAIKKPVIVAVDAGNLAAVAKVINDTFPSKNIVIAADNDITKEQMGKNNVGKMQAEAAAQAVRGFLALPRFTPGEIAKGASDFNDLAKSRGLDEVSKQMNIVLNKAKENPKAEQKNEKGNKKPIQQELKRQVTQQMSR